MRLRKVEQEEPIPGINTVSRTFLLAILAGIGLGIGYFIVGKVTNKKK